MGEKASPVREMSWVSTTSLSRDQLSKAQFWLRASRSSREEMVMVCRFSGWGCSWASAGAARVNTRHRARTAHRILGIFFIFRFSFLGGFSRQQI